MPIAVSMILSLEFNITFDLLRYFLSFTSNDDMNNYNHYIYSKITPSYSIPISSAVTNYYELAGYDIHI